MALRQSLSQKLEQKLSPQQIQLMKLLQIPAVELDQRVKQELEINPALEEGREDDYEDEFEREDDFQDEVDGEERDFDIDEYFTDDEPAYKTQISNRGKDDEDKSMPLSSGKSFQELLIGQLNLEGLSDAKKKIAIYLVGNLDDSGYLDRDIDAIVDDLAFYQNIETSEEELIEILKEVQKLDPPGVGARDLKECLVLQMQR